MVEEVSGDWKFTGENCATNASNGVTPSSSAPEHEGDSSTLGAWRTGRSSTRRRGTSTAVSGSKKGKLAKR